MGKWYILIYAGLLVIFVVIITFPVSAQLADSAWPCFRHDAKHTGQSPYIGPQTPTLKWSYTTKYVVESSPAIGTDGTIYVGSDNNLYAINPSGSLKWSFNINVWMIMSPAIGSDGTIYVGSMNNVFYAINPNGTLKWIYATIGTITSSPAIGTDGTIYVGSNDYNLYAINSNGTLKWTYTTGNYVTSTPAIGTDGTIYVGSYDQKLYSINSNGSFKWTYTTGDEIESSPAIGSDGTIYIGSNDDNLYAINSNGSFKWSYTTWDVVRSSPAIGSDGTIYVGSHDYNLYAFNPDGTVKFTYYTGAKIISSPAIGADGSVYVGSYDHRIYSINSNGSLKWTYDTSSQISCSPAIGADGTVYIGDWWNFKLFAISDITPTPTLTASSTPTLTLTSIPTFTATLTQTATLTPTLTQTPTKTPTQTKTSTPTLTPTPTFTDAPPILEDGAVIPESGNQETTFEFYVYYSDPDGGSPTEYNAYINGGQYMLNLKNGDPWNGIYNTLVSGSQLLAGNNQFNFIFMDDEGNGMAYPGDGSNLSGPYVSGGTTSTPIPSNTPSQSKTATKTPTNTATGTPTKTSTLTNTPTGTPTDTHIKTQTETPNPSDTKTQTSTPVPTISQTPTNSPTPSGTPQKCLRIASPSDFYYNTVLLSWTPIFEAAYYQFDCVIAGSVYSFKYYDNQIRIIAQNKAEWEVFDSLGTIYYRVTALDASGNIIDGPTEIAFFKCKANNTKSTEQYEPDGVAGSGCLRIANPHEFYFNTILLSWTPIIEADHYLFEYQYNNETYSAMLEDNYLRLIIDDANLWKMLTFIGPIPFRVSAMEADGDVYEGPTDWFAFSCK